MEEQQEGGDPSSALGGGLSFGPPSAVLGVQAGAGSGVRPSPSPPCPQGAGVWRAVGLQPTRGCWQGGCCEREGAGAAFGAASTTGLTPQCCVSAPHFHQLGTA